MSDSDTERQKRVDRYNWHCQRESKITGLPRDHQIVAVRAGLAFVYEKLLDRVVDSGSVTDLSAFVKLSELELQFAPKAPPPHIEIVFSDEGGPSDRAPSSDTPSAIDTGQVTDTVQATDNSVDSVPTDEDLAEAADTEFKKQFGPTATRGVAPAPPPPMDYMTSLKAEAKRTGYFPAVRFDDHGVPSPPKAVRHIGGFLPSDVGGHDRPRNPFSVINDPLPGSRPEHLDKR